MTSNRVFRLTTSKTLTHSGKSAGVSRPSLCNTVARLCCAAIACWVGQLSLPADAGQVTVQTSGLLASDPLFIEDTGNIADPFGPNWKASADLPNGELKALADFNTTNNNLNGFPTASAFLEDAAPYNGVTRVFPAGYFELEVDAAYMQTGGGAQTGIRTLGSRLEANISLSINGTTIAFATVQHATVFEQGFAGNLNLISDVFTPNTSGGATVTQNSVSSSGVDLVLKTPQFTLDPDDVFGYSAGLSVVALASGSLNQSTTDAFNTAKLSFRLPPGVSPSDFNFGDNSPFTPTWVQTIPEPSAGLLAVLAALGSVLLVRK